MFQFQWYLKNLCFSENFKARVTNRRIYAYNSINYQARQNCYYISSWKQINKIGKDVSKNPCNQHVSSLFTP